MSPHAFEQMTREALAQIENLTDASVRRAGDILREVQSELLTRLAGAPSEYNQWFYTEMLDYSRQIFHDLQQQYTEEIGAMLDAVADNLEKAIDRPVRDATGMRIILPHISRQTVEFLSGYAPGQLIKKLTDNGYAHVAEVLRQGLLGLKTPFEVQQALIGTLHEAGIIGSLQHRAEVIWRTEAGRVFNVLAAERYKQVSRDFPGRFLKQWLHSGNTRNPRPRHVALGQASPIPVEEKFNVNGWLVDGPHDPALPVQEVVQCGCTSILTMNKEWEG